MPSVFVTGASGLLGRAIVDAFRARSEFWTTVTPCSHTRALPGGVQLDLRDAAAAAALLAALRPSLVVHAAAERRPDVCEQNAAASEALNVEAVWHLARAAAAAGAHFVFISTDYLWTELRRPTARTRPCAP